MFCTEYKQIAFSYSVLHWYQIADKILALSCDMTAAISGMISGACAIIEQFLGTGLLKLS